MLLNEPFHFTEGSKVHSVRLQLDTFQILGTLHAETGIERLVGDITPPDDPCRAAASAV